MNVKYSYLQEQFCDSQAIIDEIKKLVRCGDFTLGKPVAVFEQEFARLIGAKYAVGVNSGTDAIFLSLRAIGVGPGDEILTTPNTFIATIGAIVAAGARPVFVDVTDEYTINPELIERAITSKTKAIVPVHYAGHPADMKAVMQLARQHGLHVVEDTCQAIDAAIDKRRVGTFGITGCFSLHPLKNLNVWGDGGMIVTNSAKVRDKLILLRNHGLKNRDEVEIFGYNSRLDSLQAMVGHHLIRSVNAITNSRIKWAHRYDAALAELREFITIPRRRPDKKYVYHLYIISVKRRDPLHAFLNKNHIEAKIHYPIPLHLQKAARGLGYKKGDFPVTEAQCKSIITLPVHQHLSCEQIDYVIRKVKEFYS